MEGIAGIDDYRDCLPSHPGAYARGRRLMTDEVLAVVTALRDGGAERITVGDWHMVGTNIERERMPAGVEVRPIADLALTEAEPSMSRAAGGGKLDAVVLIGHHASTPTKLGFCSHTFIWEMEVLLDGESLCEAQAFAQGLAAEGIPALAVSGDSRMLETFGEGELGSARPGHGQGGPGSRRGPLAGPGHGPGRALLLGRRRARRPAGAAPAPLLSGRAADHRRRRGAREHHRLRAGGAAGDDRRRLPLEPGLTRVPPAGEADARRVGVRRRLGSLLATPVMLAKERRWLAAAP